MTQRCKYESVVSAFADGELSNGDIASVKSHLSDCSICRRLLEAYREIDDSIRNLPTTECADHVERKLMAQLAAFDATPRWIANMKDLFGGWRPAWAAAAMMCFLVGIILYSGHEKDALTPEDIIIAQHMDFFQNYEIIQKLDLLENWDMVSRLKDNS